MRRAAPCNTLLEYGESLLGFPCGFWHANFRVTHGNGFDNVRSTAFNKRNGITPELLEPGLSDHAEIPRQRPVLGRCLVITISVLTIGFRIRSTRPGDMIKAVSIPPTYICSVNVRDTTDEASEIADGHDRNIAAVDHFVVDCTADRADLAGLLQVSQRHGLLIYA